LIDLALSSCIRRSAVTFGVAGGAGGYAPAHLTDPSPAVYPPLLSSLHFFVITLPFPISFSQFPHNRCALHASCQRNLEPRQARKYASTLSPISQLLFKTLAIVTPYSRHFLLYYSVSAKAQSVFRSLRSNQRSKQSPGPKLYNHLTISSLPATFVRTLDPELQPFVSSDHFVLIPYVSLIVIDSYDRSINPSGFILNLD
jgi:hypothetical protein